MTNAPDQKAEGAASNMYMPGGHVEVTAGSRQDVPAQLRRRRRASLRLEPLQDGRRDPWTPRRDGSHDRELDAWTRALAHLAAVGLTGLAPADVRRSLEQRRSAA